MRYRRIFLILQLNILFFSSFVFAAAVSVDVEVNKKNVTIGEEIKYRITVSADKNTEIEMPDLKDVLTDFNIKDSGFKTQKLFSKKKIHTWYVLDSYNTGKLKIPKVIVKYKEKSNKQWEKIEAKEQLIEVKSLLANNGVVIPLRDIKPPVNLPSSQRFYLPVLILVFIAGLIYLGLKFLKKKIETKIEVKRSADEIAFEQLEELKRKNLIAQGKTKEYYSCVSDIIRHYLENRFELHAPEMTTEEFLFYVRDYAQVIFEHKVLLKEFLLLCDLVKFAKYVPSEQEIDSVYQSARKFIVQTKEESMV